MINTAIVGFGYAATVFHLPLLQSNTHFKVTAVVSSQPGRVNKLVPQARCFDSLDELLKAPHKPDLVIITTPNMLHFEQATRCLDQGIAVHIEKPFVTSVVQATQLFDLAGRRQTSVHVFQNRRFDGDYITLKKLLKRDYFGEVKLFQSRFDRFRPRVRERWRELPGVGTGILYDLGPHLLDQALDLFGRPDAVNATVDILRQHSSATDYFNLQLYYPDKIVELASSPFSAAPCRRFVIQSVQGEFLKMGLDRQEAALKQGLLPGSHAWQQATQESAGTWYTDGQAKPIATQSGLYTNIYDTVAGSLMYGRAGLVDEDDLLAQIDILERISHSPARGKIIELAS